MRRFQGSRRLRQRMMSLYGLIVFALPSVLYADDSERLKAQFLDEGPRAWEEYRGYTNRLQGTFVSKWTVNGKIHTSFRLGFKSNPHCKMVSELEPLHGSPAEDVHAFNSFYAFDLKRKSTHDPWVMTDLRMGEFQGTNAKWEDFTPLRWCILVRGMYELPGLVRLPNFHVISASKVRKNEIDLCQIDFESKKGSGTLLLDPTHFWTLRHCNIRVTSSSGPITDLKQEQDTELRDVAAKYPIPKHCTIDKEWKTAKGELTQAHAVIDFDLKEASEPPEDKEFTLSAFGLPEPIGVAAPEKSHTYLWIALSAIGAVALAVFFRWMARRTRKG